MRSLALTYQRRIRGWGDAWILQKFRAIGNDSGPSAVRTRNQMQEVEPVRAPWPGDQDQLLRPGLHASIGHVRTQIQQLN